MFDVWAPVFSRLKVVNPGTIAKAKLVYGDGSNDDEVSKVIGSLQLNALYSTRASNEGDDANSLEGSVSIGAGSKLVRCIYVQPGQRVSWSFEVEPGNAWRHRRPRV